MAVLIPIADAIVSELNNASRSWYGTFTAERMNVPKISREDSACLQVIVTPLDKTSKKITRRKTEHLCRYLVGFQKQLASGSNAETDPLIAIGETVEDYFEDGLKLATYAACCEQSDFGTDTETPWMAITDNENLLLFTAVLRLTFRAHT